MNYYAARKRMSDGRYDYTRMHDGHVFPTGYCHEFIEPKSDTRIIWSEFELKKLEQHRAKFHKDGHATEDEACDCYRQWLLDFKLQLNLSSGDEYRLCLMCQRENINPGIAVNTMAECDFHIFHLCPAHMTRESAEALMPKIGSITSSY